MKKLMLLAAFSTLAYASDIVRYRELTKRTPDSETKHSRVWNIRQTDVHRVNLVEFRGETSLHKHPDAEHSLLVLEGRVRVLIGTQTHDLEKGDFVSVPKDVAHKYWPLTRIAMLVSTDAPYYDPKKTIPLETSAASSGTAAPRR